MGLSAYAEIVAADVTVQVVIKGALLTVLKEDADQTGSAH
jgi:hypothetical protein